MKNIFKYLFLFMAFSCKSQVTSIVPLNSLSFEHPNGVYIKDTNSEFDYYIGRWEGVINNKKYIFEFVKFPQQLRGFINRNYYYTDELKAKFKVIDLTTNQVLYDDLNVTNYRDYLILGLAKRDGVFRFWYRDKIEKCHLTAEFNLNRIIGQPNQLKYCYFSLKNYGVGMLDGCPNYQDIDQIPMFLPNEDLIFTKQ